MNENNLYIFLSPPLYSVVKSVYFYDVQRGRYLILCSFFSFFYVSRVVDLGMFFRVFFFKVLFFVSFSGPVRLLPFLFERLVRVCKNKKIKIYKKEERDSNGVAECFGGALLRSYRTTSGSWPASRTETLPHEDSSRVNDPEDNVLKKKVMKYVS